MLRKGAELNKTDAKDGLSLKMRKKGADVFVLLPELRYRDSPILIIEIIEESLVNQSISQLFENRFIYFIILNTR